MGIKINQYIAGNEYTIGSDVYVLVSTQRYSNSGYKHYKNDKGKHLEFTKDGYNEFFSINAINQINMVFGHKSLNQFMNSTPATQSTDSTDSESTMHQSESTESESTMHQSESTGNTSTQSTVSTDSESTDSESTDSTESTESENTMQHTDSTDSESTPTAPAIIDNTNKDYSIEHDGFVVTVSHTTHSTVYENVYMNNGNENNHLKSTYEYMKNQRKNAPYNATVKYNPITNAWCTTYTAPAIEIDYNAPTQYYQQYKINVAQHRQQSEQKRQQKRQQKQNSRYENNSVKTVYESMTKNRKHEKIRAIQNRIMQNDIDAYYNTPATIEHE
jgi:hypothetical protein